MTVVVVCLRLLPQNCLLNVTIKSNNAQDSSSVMNLHEIILMASKNLCKKY